ncbi:MAG: hypothetical protein WBE74_01265 [Terracidiphilus sp.]
MHWVKERILECEWLEPASIEKVHRIHFRFRSDGSMWYQVSRRGGFYDREPAELEKKFSRFLVSDVSFGAHRGWTEQDFDDDFNERLQKMNGKEITPTEKASV